MGFFEFYANFDYNNRAICVITGQLQAKRKNMSRNIVLDIVNPLNPRLNVANFVHLEALLKFKKGCQNACIKFFDIESDSKQSFDGPKFLHLCTPIKKLPIETQKPTSSPILTENSTMIEMKNTLDEEIRAQIGSQKLQIKPAKELLSNEDNSESSQSEKKSDKPKLRTLGDQPGVDLSNPLIIFFDTENTTGGYLGEIFQIGAVASTGEKYFANILPKGPIDPIVSKLTKMKIVDGSYGGRHLYDLRTHQRVKHDNYSRSQYFLDWILKLKKLKNAENLILVSHGLNDAIWLINDFRKMKQGFGKIDAFGDALIKRKLMDVFKENFPNDTFEAHNALGDAKALFKILTKNPNDVNEIVKNAFILEDMIKLTEYHVNKALGNQDAKKINNNVKNSKKKSKRFFKRKT